MDELLAEIGRAVAEQAEEAYFVGGCVRDALRGEPVKDLDFALRGDTAAIGRALAREHQGHVFPLREEDGVVRVLLPEQAGLQIDLCPFQGRTIEEDLAARDLTVNAMGLPAAAGLSAVDEVLDPTGGREDLAAGVVRFAAPDAPERDPLRVMRAFRFRWKLGFELAPGTLERIRECAPLLHRVSVERVRDELFQLLALPDPTGALEECLQAELARWLVGRGIGSFAPAVERVRGLVGVLEGRPELNRLLVEPLTPSRRRREALLWAAVLAAVGSAAEADASARYLALSNDERHLITRGIAGAERARDLVSRWPVPGRHRYRLFREAGKAGPEAVLLAGAGGWSVPFEELLSEALRRHFWPEPPLLNGLEVMQILGTGAGPQVGRALEEIEEARADGLLRTPAAAAAWLRERVGRK